MADVADGDTPEEPLHLPVIQPSRVPWPEPWQSAKPRCGKCGLVLETVMGYVCPDLNCPTFMKVICGSTLTVTSVSTSLVEATCDHMARTQLTVGPLPAPTGSIFTLPYTYGDTTGNIIG